MFRTRNSFLVNILLITGIGATIVVNPWFAYDPINLPKMLVLSMGAAIWLGPLISNFKVMWTRDKILLTLIGLLIFSLLISFFTNEAPWPQQLWGTWGRSTGLITYISFLVVLMAATLVANESTEKYFRLGFERLSYFISIYTLMQLMDIDPINWSQKLMVATLGNINFMSSFLGMATISLLARVIVEKAKLVPSIHYLFFASLNLYLIYVSKSIQGIGVFLAGVAFLISFVIREKKDFIKSQIAFFSSVFVGVIALAGTAGIGPLSRFRQETVEFRLDYWRAGIKMASSNVLNGIGLDTYGDYYREYRNLEAVTRTGPQRVANTAHNIFLDVTSGSGVIAGTLLILIFLLTAFRVLRRLHLRQLSYDYVAITGMWFGFLVFMMISINQIGVGVWGFLFTGLLHKRVTRPNNSLARSEEKKSKQKVESTRAELKSQTIEMSDLNLGILSRLLSTTLLVLVFFVSVVPNVADARFLKAIKTGNLDLAIQMSELSGIQSFHREVLMVRLNENGRTSDVLKVARVAIQENPRNWAAWVQIAFNRNATKAERILASRKLYELDPNNNDVRVEFEASLKKE